MPPERSAGAVIFRNVNGIKEYLLLHYPDKLSKRARGRVRGHWDFPKGHMEKGEKTEDTVRREVKEETGISKIDLIHGFRETLRYFVGPKNKRRLKFVVFFVASTKQFEVTISHEHQGFTWLPFKEAQKLITYSNSKKLIKRADDFLRRKSF